VCWNNVYVIPWLNFILIVGIYFHRSSRLWNLILKRSASLKHHMPCDLGLITFLLLGLMYGKLNHYVIKVINNSRSNYGATLDSNSNWNFIPATLVESSWNQTAMFYRVTGIHAIDCIKACLIRLWLSLIDLLIDYSSITKSINWSILVYNVHSINYCNTTAVGVHVQLHILPVE